MIGGGPFGSVPFGSVPSAAGGGPPLLVLRIGPDDTTAKYLKVFEWSISKELNARDTFDCTLIIDDGYRPLLGQEVIFTINGVRQFAGTINDKKERFLTEGESVWRTVRLTCTDWNQILDRRSAVKSYDDTFAGAMVRDLIDSYLDVEGIVPGNIQDGLSFTHANWNHEYISNILDELSKDVGYYWFVDYEKRLHFLPRDAATAPFGINELNSKVADFESSESRNGYRNTQIIKGWKEIADVRTERFVGDGEAKTFTLAYPLYSAPTVTVNGQPQTVGLRGVQNDKQWYWSRDQNELNQGNEQTDVALGVTDILQVTYIGSYPGITYQQNIADVQARAAIEGGSGIYEAIDTDASLEGGEVVIARGAGLLRRYQLEAEGEFTIYQDGLDIGQLLPVDYPSLGLDEEEMLITRVELSQISPEVRQYRISCTTGEAKNAFKEFWMTFARTGQKVGVREGEIVQHPVPLTDEMTLSDASSATSAAQHTWIVDVDEVDFMEVG